MSAAVEQVAARMRAIEARLPDGDGVRAFTRVYRVVTEQVRDALTGSDTFANPAFVERLDVVFADRFFAVEDAAAAGHDVSPAWAPLVEARRRPGVLAVQHVLAGMNAHINHDLALAVVQTCSETGRSVHDSNVATDFQAGRPDATRPRPHRRARRTGAPDHHRRLTHRCPRPSTSGGNTGTPVAADAEASTLVTGARLGSGVPRANLSGHLSS